MAGFAAAVGFGREILADTIEMFRMLGPVQRQVAMGQSLPRRRRSIGSWVSFSAVA
jgi:hypothetical protein